MLCRPWNWSSLRICYPRGPQYHTNSIFGIYIGIHIIQLVCHFCRTWEMALPRRYLNVIAVCPHVFVFGQFIPWFRAYIQGMFIIYVILILTVIILVANLFMYISELSLPWSCANEWFCFVRHSVNYGKKKSRRQGFHCSFYWSLCGLHWHFQKTANHFSTKGKQLLLKNTNINQNYV